MIYTKHRQDASMQQPYANTVYGAPMSSTLTSGYGTINPGPAQPPKGFEGSTGVGEMLGVAADDTNIAQYAPTIHRLEVKIDSSSKTSGTRNGLIGPGFYPEGTIFRIEGDTAAGEENALVRVFLDGGKISSISNPSDHVFLILASDHMIPAGTRAKTTHMAFAFKGVQRVLLPGGGLDARVAAGAPIYIKATLPADEKHEVILHDSNPLSEPCTFLGVLTLPFNGSTDNSVSVCLL